MVVTVTPLGFYKKYLREGEQDWRFVLHEPTTVKELLCRSELDVSKFFPVVLVNGRHQKEEYVLQDGDQVVITTLLGGG